jgi:hypothetical protein
MGYSIYVKVKTPEEAREFYDHFYDTCEKGINAVIKQKHPTYPLSEDKYSALCIGEDIGYLGGACTKCHGEGITYPSEKTCSRCGGSGEGDGYGDPNCYIGFRYNASGAERTFTWEVVRMIQREVGDGDYIFYDSSPTKLHPTKNLKEEYIRMAKAYDDEDRSKGRESIYDKHLDNMVKMGCISYDDNVSPDQIRDIIDDEVLKLSKFFKK